MDAAFSSDYAAIEGLWIMLPSFASRVVPKAPQLPKLFGSVCRDRMGRLGVKKGWNISAGCCAIQLASQLRVVIGG